MYPGHPCVYGRIQGGGAVPPPKILSYHNFQKRIRLLFRIGGFKELLKCRILISPLSSQGEGGKHICDLRIFSPPPLNLFLNTHLIDLTCFPSGWAKISCIISNLCSNLSSLEISTTGVSVLVILTLELCSLVIWSSEFNSCSRYSTLASRVLVLDSNI